ncbi:MAG: hypothetical protein WCD57_06690 [Acidobacteriaceae bacterium]
MRFSLRVSPRELPELMDGDCSYDDFRSCLRSLEQVNRWLRSAWSCRMFGWMGEMVEWHRFVRHDGPVSFRRAFRKEDWVRLLVAAEVPLATVTVKHWRPGRLCVGRWK